MKLKEIWEYLGGRAAGRGNIEYPQDALVASGGELGSVGLEVHTLHDVLVHELVHLVPRYCVPEPRREVSGR